MKMIAVWREDDPVLLVERKRGVTDYWTCMY